MWSLVQFINQNTEIKDKKNFVTMIISDLKEVPILLKTGIPFFWDKRMDIDI